ncbi:MAG: hypothetical protein KDB03_11370 [Planctomycetales bacterium]|nr:hypothetical protein [Planctomycetales bacterium]
MPDATPPAADLESLVALFFSDAGELAEFESVDEDSCPAAYRSLLAHSAHMTVTVERRHTSPVDVVVVREKKTQTHYSRVILLRRQSDGRVVQFGIVRLALNTLQPDVRSEILSGKIPLGRVLIQHNVMRQVQLLGLWRVHCGAELARLLDCSIGQETYGRSALIFCDCEPAVELLEIVAPEGL